MTKRMEKKPIQTEDSLVRVVTRPDSEANERIVFDTPVEGDNVGVMLRPLDGTVQE